MGCWFRRGMLVPLLAVFGLVASSVPVGASTTFLSVVRSNWEIAHTAEGWNVHRDGGTSVVVPGQPGRSMWFFGDHYFTDAAGEPLYGDFSFWPGTRAAISVNTPGQVPSLSEVPPPGLHGAAGPAIVVPNNDAPQPTPFLPAPTGLVNPSTGAPCGAAGSNSLPVAWYEGATPGPAGPMTVYDGTTPVNVAEAANLLFIPYLEGCLYDIVDGSFQIIVPRLGMAVYEPARNSILAQRTIFTAPAGQSVPWQQSLGSPVFHGGFLYTYGAHCDSWVEALKSCATTGGPSAPAGRVVQLRVPQGLLHDPLSYQWKTASGWGGVGDTAPIPSTPEANGLGPIWARVKDFRSVGEGFVLTEQFSYGAHYRLWQSSTPTGPWSLVETDQFASCPTTAGTFCYGLEGHPEISTASNIVFTLFDHATGGELEANSLGPLP
jgi:hypothetical protein